MKEEAKLRKSRGITLIALVITIIVLLILAGVSIAMLTGDNGILTQANRAALENRGAAVEEAKDLWETNKTLDKNISNSTAQSLAELVADLEEQGLLIDDEPEQVLTTGQVTIGSRTIVFGLNAPTLVEMFEQAQKDGCTNEDGTCTREDHLHIGDYVDYKNPTSGSYSVTEAKSGVGGIGNQTYSVANNQLNWRVLGIDESTDGLKLVAGSPMKLDDIEGKEDPYLYLYGAEAYVYGPDEMNAIGALYKNQYASSARSINMEDINQALGITDEEQIKANNAMAASGIIQYGEQYGPFENQYTPESYLSGPTRTTVGGTVSAYAYFIGNEEGMIQSTNSRLNSMLFDSVKLGSQKAYWVAGRGAYAVVGGDGAFFGPGAVFENEDFSRAGLGYSAFYSSGSRSSGGLAVRPVVVLKSDVTSENVPKIADKTEETWNYDSEGSGGGLS